LKGICVNKLVGNPVQLGRERIVFNFGMNKRLECSGY